MSKEGYDFVKENYSREALADKYITILQEIAKGKGK